MSSRLDVLPEAVSAAGDPVAADVQKRAPGQHLRLFYIIRTATVLGALGMAFWYLARAGSFNRYHVFVFLFGLVYPHFSYFLEKRLEASRRIEHATLLLDAFISGSVMHFMDLSLLPSLAVAMIAVANPVAYTGFSMIGWSVLAMFLGIALPSWTYGLNLAPGGLLEINLAAAIYLFVYYCMFAYAVFARTNALQKSRRELHQQKIVVEIEKKRSDALLLGILPGNVAKEFESTAAVVPRRHERAAILAVALPELSRSAEKLGPDEFFAEMNHVFKALDAICGRHGLESIKSTGDRYRAASGFGQHRAIDAEATLRAALEIRRFLEEHNAARAAHNLPPHAFQIAAHAGPVVAGVVETRKFGYDLFGDAVADVEHILLHAPCGDVVVTGALCEQGGSGFAFRRIEDVPAGKDRRIPLYVVAPSPDHS